MLIFLVGYMGCGKSTIGRTLAKQLGVRFLDMDTLLEQRCGKSVAEIFTETGETGFRQSEREVLAELTSEREAIVATGGGAPCFFDNMETMNRAGVPRNWPGASNTARRNGRCCATKAKKN